MKQVHYNSTIECISAEIISRKILPSSFIEIAPIGRCFTYKCTRNSQAKIRKELTPKKAIYNINSRLDIGDKLECENLFVAVNKNKPYTPDVINKSGRHKAQIFKTREYTMAKVTRQILNIPDLDPKER